MSVPTLWCEEEQGRLVLGVPGEMMEDAAEP